MRGSLCYFCEGLGVVAPKVMEMTTRTVIITILSGGFETRIDLDVKNRPRELEVKTNAENWENCQDLPQGAGTKTAALYQ